MMLISITMALEQHQHQERTKEDEAAAASRGGRKNHVSRCTTNQSTKQLTLFGNKA
jgi:hypothetical protein